MSVVLTTSP